MLCARVSAPQCEGDQPAAKRMRDGGVDPMAFYPLTVKTSLKPTERFL